jgi:hypothetical protein
MFNTPEQIEQRRKLVAELPAIERQLKGNLSRSDRLTALFKAYLAYQSLGEPQKQLNAAQEIARLEQSAKSNYTLGEAYRYAGLNGEACKAFETAHHMQAGLPPDIVRMIEERFTDALFMSGRWKEAREFLLSKKRSPNIWTGENCERVAFYLSGGFGDVMFFARLTDLARKIVRNPLLVLPRSPIRGLAVKPYPEDFRQFLASQGYEIEDEQTRGTHPECFPELLCSVLNLDPSGSWAQEIPLWKADPPLIEKHAGLRTSSRPLYGLCWEGERLEGQMFFETGIHRQLTDKQAQRIVSETSKIIDWVSLQRGKTFEGLQATPLTTWAETAAVIANLDAVVTVDTSVLHLAAAMGKPTFVLLAGPSDPKFPMEGDSCPFYPTVKLFRSTFGFDGAVEAVIQNINPAQVSL